VVSSELGGFKVAFSRQNCRDRRKLTFYFIADKRIDFRELVRELFRYVLGSAGVLTVAYCDYLGCSRRESGSLLFRRVETTSSEGFVLLYFYGSLKRSVC
jgi:hypothetical protein